MFLSQKKKKGKNQLKNFDGFFCEMEGAAIEQVATLNNIPFTLVRLISDLPNNQGPEGYFNFEKESEKCVALEIFLEE